LSIDLESWCKPNEYSRIYALVDTQLIKFSGNYPDMAGIPLPKAYRTYTLVRFIRSSHSDSPTWICISFFLINER
jgi:hypothetical protein